MGRSTTILGAGSELGHPSRAPKEHTGEDRSTRPKLPERREGLKRSRIKAERSSLRGRAPNASGCRGE